MCPHVLFELSLIAGVSCVITIMCVEMHTERKHCGFELCVNKASATCGIDGKHLLLVYTCAPLGLYG